MSAPSQPTTPAPNAEQVVVVLATAAEAEAPDLARGLVERRLVACVNLLPTIRSFYFWEGEVQDDAEALLVMKTTRSTVPALRSAFVELHSYDVPELLVLGVEDGLPAYLSWVGTEVAAAPSRD